jgi:hypothetical protein
VATFQGGSYKLSDSTGRQAGAGSLAEALNLAAEAIRQDCGPVTITHETVTQLVTITVTSEDRKVKREPIGDGVSCPW